MGKNPWENEIVTIVINHGKEEGLWGREVDPSGNRWQVGGSWATDETGLIRWGAVSKTADDIPDLVEGCRSLGAY